MSTVATEEQVEQVVIDSLVSFGAERADIDREATFEALDVDSLDLAELAQVVEERFGVELRGSDVANVKTVGDAVSLITERIS
jgi:acyl carrier protein